MTDTKRSSFSLNGPSIALDARTHAVRGDLADIALAGKLFVPHYAEPMDMRCRADTQVRIAADSKSEVACPLKKGDIFRAVDMAGEWAWGFVADDHLVGYVALDHLEQVK